MSNARALCRRTDSCYDERMRRRIIQPKTDAQGRGPMDEALRFLGARARSVREVERRLDECQFGEVEIHDVVERLKELGLLDDAAYAREFVRTRLNTKPVSRAHLKEQLLAHEVDREAIDEALAELADGAEAESALRVAEKYARQYARLPIDERREIVLRRLDARGYAFDVSRAAADAALSEEEA